ncbi:hypothetical protein AQ490_10210 [Wenjunlia vitaminophila]|uniref:AIM24 family protein n=1 Tax=Wenjunlia vitaminophila TaxID=76728 RepID=A0A0T6LM67_WENVI|nr:AIM24 family protein [Wenjunlia vitaminophila]KRV47112.1 hypothetical protein AQ490_10210 [Wenjunlia vitaminophila]
MQSPLFANTENQSQDRYALQNEQMLRVRVDGNTEVLARKGAMVAYQGLVDFDGEYQSQSQRRSRRRTGEGLDLMRCSGQGTVYLANLAQYIHIMDIANNGITVDSQYVLALDTTLNYDVIAVDSEFGISGTGAYNLHITGRGKLALMTSGKPLLMHVTPDKYAYADADAVVAWSTDLRVQMQSQTTNTPVFRRRGNTGEGWELGFVGNGYVLVQPSEQMPPQNAPIGRGAAAQYGLGQQGARGRNQGNAWSNR